MLSEGYGRKFLGPFFRHIIKEKGPNVLLNLWRTSGLNFTGFMVAEDVQSFVDENVSFSQTKNCIRLKCFNATDCMMISFIITMKVVI